MTYSNHSTLKLFTGIVLAGLALMLLPPTHVFSVVRANLAMLALTHADELDNIDQTYLDASGVLAGSGSPITRGLALFYAGQWDEAAKALIGQAEANPADPVVFFWLGNIQSQRGLQTDAIEAWRRAGSARYWALRGLDAAETGNVDVAYEFAGRAVNIDPGDAVVQYEIGRLYFKIQDWSKAVDALSLALATADLDEAWIYDALMLRGQVYSREAGHLELAQADFERAMSLRPEDPWPYLRLCYALGINGKPDQGINACSRGLDFGSGSAFAHYYMGWVLYQAHKWDEAALEFRKALSIDPSLRAVEEWLSKVESIE